MVEGHIMRQLKTLVIGDVLATNRKEILDRIAELEGGPLTGTTFVNISEQAWTGGWTETVRSIMGLEVKRETDALRAALRELEEQGLVYTGSVDEDLIHVIGAGGSTAFYVDVDQFDHHEPDEIDEAFCAEVAVMSLSREPQVKDSRTLELVCDVIISEATFKTYGSKIMLYWLNKHQDDVFDGPQFEIVAFVVTADGSIERISLKRFPRPERAAEQVTS